MYITTPGSLFFSFFIIYKVFLKISLFLFYVYEYFPCMYLRVLCACLVHKKAIEDAGFPGTGVRDGYKLPYGCQSSYSGPLEELQVLIIDDPSLQSHIYI